MVPSTRFTDPAAVDAWDHWFRWRNGDGLRDRTIDATWCRVADAIATAPSGGEHRGLQRYIEAFRRWQLLPDERLLRSAGTADRLGPLTSPAATLNVAAFVIAPLTRQARLDAEGLARVATLAVHLLDDTLVAMQGASSHLRDLRIGLLGVADALGLLGIPYGDVDAATMMKGVGAALAQGTLRGTVELARQRGPIDRHPAHRVGLWRDRGMPEPLIQDALRWGVRHIRLSAIQRQPRLALLANNSSDALDPPATRHRIGIATVAGIRTPLSRSTASTTSTGASTVSSQLALRAAIQPWIDTPIDYPLVTTADTDPQAPVGSSQAAQAYNMCDSGFGSN